MRLPAEASHLHIRRLLVPCDFSPPSVRALVYALKFAAQFKTELHVLHVAEPVTHAPAHCNVADFIQWQETAGIQIKERLETLVRHLATECQLPALGDLHFSTSHGEPGAEIVKTAASLDVDLIIIATHGYTGIKRFMLGSTTQKVVVHAGCPVLVVREREHEFVALPDAAASKD